MSARSMNWGEICCSRKQRQHAFYWMGARIVEVRVPQMKENGEGGKPPFGLKRQVQKSRRRKHQRGTRSSRVSRPTGKVGQSEDDNLAPNRTRPGTTKKATTAIKARTRFVNWVDRSVERIRTRLIAEIDMDAWVRWEKQDFHPTMVPWLRFDRRLQFYRFPDVRTGKFVERECFRSSRRAHDLKTEFLADLAEKKGRKPPPLYVENALAVKLRSWMSGGLPFPREGYVPMVELNQPWDGQSLRTLQANEAVRVCAWCGRSCVGLITAASNQVKCPVGTGCRVWQTRQAQNRRRVPRGSPKRGTSASNRTERKR